MHTEFPSLPIELHVHILSYLPVSKVTDCSIKTLLNCLRVNSTVRAAAVTSSVWQPHYLARYTHCDHVNEEQRRESSDGDYRLMYSERRRLDQNAIRILHTMVTTRPGRCQLAKMFSFDVWDVLELQVGCPIPVVFRGEADAQESETPIVEHAVTLRFWAKQILGVIGRTYAISLWSRIQMTGTEGTPSFEEIITGLSAFLGHSPVEISSDFDCLARKCNDYLASRCLTVSPENSGGQVAEICTSICAFMRGEGFSGTGLSRFHRMMNHFPHRVLTTNKQTIPLSLVHVFVAISRRLGIAASPVDFPGKVLAHVSSPLPMVSDIFVDVYASNQHPIVSVEDDMPGMLVMAGAPPVIMPKYTRPAQAAPMLFRAAQNILQWYPDAEEGLLEAEGEAANYAVYCIHLLFTSDPPLIAPMMNHILVRSLESATVLSRTLLPRLHGQARKALLASCQEIDGAEDLLAAKVHLRSLAPVEIKYFAGMVFEHIKHHYFGCIIGWQPKCMASEEWITQMDIDSLSRGREQPFYNVLALQSVSARYVAEENIKPLHLTREVAKELYSKVGLFGMFFVDAQLHHEGHRGVGRLILSPELQATFPEDSHFGSTYSIAESAV